MESSKINLNTPVINKAPPISTNNKRSQVEKKIITASISKAIIEIKQINAYRILFDINFKRFVDILNTKNA